MSHHPDVEKAFKVLAIAVQTGDLNTYRALALDPRDKFQTQLFERNSAMMKKGGMRLDLRKVVVSGDRASVAFVVVSPTGERVEEGEMTFASVDGAWKVTEL
jgi:hypothetical protein